jgi:hypothetical protein
MQLGAEEGGRNQIDGITFSSLWVSLQKGLQAGLQICFWAGIHSTDKFTGFACPLATWKDSVGIVALSVRGYMHTDSMEIKSRCCGYSAMHEVRKVSNKLPWEARNEEEVRG